MTRRGAGIGGVLALLASALPGPAAALMCAPYGISDAWAAASALETPYLVVQGRFAYDAGLLPVSPEDLETSPPPARIPFTFSGKALSRNGFTSPVTGKGTLVVACYAHWCAAPPAGDWIAFLARTPQVLVLEDDPCGMFLFEATGENRRMLFDCQAGRDCRPMAERF